MAIQAAAETAKQVDAITDISMSQETVSQSSRTTVEMTWEAPAGTVGGDYFTVEIPPEFRFVNESFSLKDPETGAAVANCTISSPLMTCTFTEYVNQHLGTKGTIQLLLRTTQTNESGQYTWVINGESKVYEGGQILPGKPSPMPDRLGKWGWLDNVDNTQVIAWSVVIPSKDLRAGALDQPDAAAARSGYNLRSLVITDTYDARLGLYPDATNFISSVRYTDAAGYTSGKWTNLTSPADYSVQVDEANHSFTLTLNDDSAKVQDFLAGDNVLRFAYGTRPYAPVDGESYTNTVSASDSASQTTETRWQSAGGQGSGGGVSATLTKKDATTGAALSNAEFKLVVGESSDGPVLREGLTTGDDGVIAISNLFKGTYSFVETKAPAGYRLDTRPITFSVTDENYLDEKSFALEFANTKATGSFQLSKVLEGDGAALADPEAEYQVDYFLDGSTEPSGTLRVKAGQTVQGPEDLPVGSTVTFAEHQPDSVDGAVWQSATFSPEQITIGDGTNTEVVAHNTLTVTPTGTLQLSATKTLEGGPLTDDQFTFQVRDAGGEILRTATNKADGSIAFKDIVGLAPGEHIFTVSEVKGEDPNIVYDTASFEVKAIVAANGSTEVELSRDGLGVESAEFVNKIAPAPVSPVDPGKPLPWTGAAILPSLAGMVILGGAGGALILAGRRRA